MYDRGEPGMDHSGTQRRDQRFPPDGGKETYKRQRMGAETNLCCHGNKNFDYHHHWHAQIKACSFS